jgi:DNA-binding transcriptional ArsR family regulator
MNDTPAETASELDTVLQSFRACTPLFEALSDKFRQDIVMLLAAEERLNVSEITERIPLSRPAISHHLKVLKQAGLVTLDRVSRENYYELSLDEPLARLRQLVDLADASCT